MSTYLELADRLIYRLANRTDIGPTSLITSRIYEYLYEGMKELANRLKNVGIRLPGLEDTIDHAMTALDDQDTYDEIIGSDGLFAILGAYNVTDSKKMAYQNEREMERLRVETPQDGLPDRWNGFADIFTVYPRGAISTTVRLQVYKMAAKPTATGNSPEIDPTFEKGLLFLAEADGWNALEDDAQSQVAESAFERWLVRRRAKDEHEKSQARTRGIRMHPSLITDRRLGI